MRKWNPWVESGESKQRLLRPGASFLDNECFIPLLKQLSMNAVWLTTTKYWKPIILQRWMNRNLHSTLPSNTSKGKAIIFGTRSLLWGRMKPESHFWKLLKTFPFAELVFQSYSIQTYLWLCSSGKWLPERETSWDLYKSASIQLQRRMSFTLSRLANVLTASEFPYVFSSYSSERTKTKRCCKKWTVGHCIFQGAIFCSFKS